MRKETVTCDVCQKVLAQDQEYHILCFLSEVWHVGSVEGLRNNYNNVFDYCNDCKSLGGFMIKFIPKKS